MLNPPRERPIAWSSPAFLCAGAVLMGAHDGAVEHRVFVVSIPCEMLENPLPDPRPGPAAEPPMHILPITEPLGQIAPGDAGTVAVKNGLDEQPIIGCRHPNVAFPLWQQVTDVVPLIVPKGVAAHGSTSEPVDPLGITRFPSWESPK